MPSFLDLLERATTGSILAEEDFYVKVLIPNVRTTAREYDIRYGPESPVMSDDETADRLFKAAVEFLARTGVYCDATNRLIRLGREEILDAAKALPEGSTFGGGDLGRPLGPDPPPRQGREDGRHHPPGGPIRGRDGRRSLQA